VDRTFRAHRVPGGARPSGRPHRVVILRRIEAADGPARVDVLLDVRGGFGRSKMRADAALLLPVIRGAVPPGDPRSSATIRAVREELAEDG